MRIKGKLRLKCLTYECDRFSEHRGYCRQHYDRLRYLGKIVPYVAKGSIHSDGYKVLPDGKFEHRMVAEKALGKPLPAGAVVHHINGDRLDNRPENLVICPDQAYHRLIHLHMMAKGIKW